MALNLEKFETKHTHTMAWVIYTHMYFCCVWAVCSTSGRFVCMRVRLLFFLA